MSRRVVRLSLAAAAASLFAMLLHAAAPKNRLRVEITSPTNGSRQPWQSQLHYAVTVDYDGKSTRFGEIPSNQVVVQAAFERDADAPSRAGPLPDALVQISRSNCTGCHDFTASAAGPSFAAIASRYSGGAATAALAQHIREGSHGSWGSGSMPPHPDLTPAQANAIAQWIVAHANDPGLEYAIGSTGTLRMKPPRDRGPHAGMVLTAYYTGPLKPGDSAAPSSGRSRVVVYGTGS